jgi:hypothetical protein
MYLFAFIVSACIFILAACNTKEAEKSTWKDRENKVGERKVGSIDTTGYKIFQSLTPQVLPGSKQIVIEVLEDARLTGLEAKMHYYPDLHAAQLVFSSDDKIFNPEEEYKPAILLMKSYDGVVILRKVLDVPCARMDTAYLNEKKTGLVYLFTLDYSTGMGSFNGPATYFVRFTDTGIANYNGEYGFASTLKSGWAIKYNGDSLEVWSKICRPADHDDFDITTKKSVLQTDSFKSFKAIKKGIWENEADTSSESLKEFFDSFM